MIITVVLLSASDVMLTGTTPYFLFKTRKQVLPLMVTFSLFNTTSIIKYLSLMKNYRINV
ncbi:hypothetical protein DFS33DRAFT_288482 [Desarmillaria ectypa]|nr:hypothetical protein DFS33DRAFT_288482 [Desarmillaria ectypa]